MDQVRKEKLNKARNTHPVLGKALFSLLIVLFYLFGKKVSVPWVIREDSLPVSRGLQAFIRAALGNDTAAGSVLAVGFMPYMTAMIIVGLFHSASGNREKTSKIRIQNEMRLITLLVALLQALMHSFRLEYAEYAGCPVSLLRGMTVIVLTAGAFAMVWMSERCQKWGLGGSSVLIFANLIQNLDRNILQSLKDLREMGCTLPGAVLVAGGAMMLTVFLALLMERSEIHLPVRHVMIHNSFSGDSDLAVKLNPVGTMAVMYVMTLFALPYYVCGFYEYLFGGNAVTGFLMRNLNLQSGWGILFFILLLVCLNCGLAGICINPKEAAEAMQKNGDYIPDCHPGEDTERRIRRVLLLVSALSSLVLCAVIAGPLILQLRMSVNSPLFMLPMSVMILSGMLLNMMNEIHTVRVINAYAAMRWGL